MLTILPLSSTSSSTETSTGSMIAMVAIWVVIALAFYFFMIRPQSKQKKAEERMRSSLEIGDEITTIGGITGRVVNINDETESLVLETGSDRNRIRIKKWAISSVDTDKGDSLPDKKDKKDKKND